jgi:hypothetical protein
MKKTATEQNLQQVKQYIIDRDFDFHQSTGAKRTILGVIGNTSAIDRDAFRNLPGVLEVFKLPEEE